MNRRIIESVIETKQARQTRCFRHEVELDRSMQLMKALLAYEKVARRPTFSKIGMATLSDYRQKVSCTVSQIPVSVRWDTAEFTPELN